MVGAAVVFAVEQTFAVLADGHRAHVGARFNIQDARHINAIVLMYDEALFFSFSMLQTLLFIKIMCKNTLFSE